MRIVGIIMLFFVPVIISYNSVDKISKRIIELKCCLIMLNEIKTRIAYSITTVADIISELSISDAYRPLSFLKESIWSNKDESFANKWKISVEKFSEICGMTKSDCELLLQFGQGLGISDLENQLSHIELYKDMFSRQLVDATDNAGSKKRLYLSIGIILGCATIIILI